MAAITLQNAVERTRRVKRILRNTSRYSHDSLGHWESAIKELKKQVRAMIFHTLVVNHKCDRDRHAARTNTHYIVDEQRSIFTLTSKDYRCDVAEFSELSWFRGAGKRSELATQRNENHRVGKDETSR